MHPTQHKPAIEVVLTILHAGASSNGPQGGRSHCQESRLEAFLQILPGGLRDCLEKGRGTKHNTQKEKKH
jgi:hypothetical protein